MTHAPGPHVIVTATSEPVLIWSGEHRVWWRENRCGYCSDVAYAGRYSLKEAIEATHHCGPEKLISIENDRPTQTVVNPNLIAAAPDMLAALKAWVAPFDGFDEAELRRLVELGWHISGIDHPTLERIRETRAAIARAEPA